MLSQCPTCKKQVEHEDYLFEVTCECGSRFNPFMGFTEMPPLDGVEPTSPPTAQTDPEPVNWEPEQPAADYSESQSVFSQLKEFAEGTSATVLNDAPTHSPPAKNPPSSATNTTKVPDKRAGAPIIVSSELPITAAATLHGFEITAYLQAVSAKAPLTDESSESGPLDAGLAALGERAAAVGASAVVSLQWAISPDGQWVYLVGTPVQCEKNQA